MSAIRFGCQTYTWQMSYDKYAGNMPHILNTVKASGFEGVEPETCMLGPYFGDYGRLKEELSKTGIRLAAVALALPWVHPEETAEENAEAAKTIEYLAHFPKTVLVLCQLPGADRSELRARQRNALACVNAVAERAAAKGIVCAFHPNSPAGSVFRVRDDYRILVEGFRSEVLGFAPDAGHIAKGGMDVLEIFKAYRPLIRHVHFKDIDAAGEWASMGSGIIGFPSLVRFLDDTKYDGWIMVEEESMRAESEPDEVTLANGRYVSDFLR